MENWKEKSKNERKSDKSISVLVQGRRVLNSVMKQSSSASVNENWYITNIIIGVNVEETLLMDVA